jgi:hypothetical protein
VLKNILSKVNMDISKDTKQMIHNYILMALNACGVDDEKKAEHHAKVASACIAYELEQCVDNSLHDHGSA